MELNKVNKVTLVTKSMTLAKVPIRGALRDKVNKVNLVTIFMNVFLRR